MCRLTGAGLAPAESARAARARYGPATRPSPEAGHAGSGSAVLPPPGAEAAEEAGDAPYRSAAPPPPGPGGTATAGGPVRTAVLPAQAGAGRTAARAGARQGGPGGGLGLGEVRRECRGPARAVVVLRSQSRATAGAPLARDLAATGWGVRGARTAPAVLTAGPGWAGPRPAGTLRPLSLREALTVLAGVRGVSPWPGPV
ncbi:hypothetical protein [Streptomyces sp. NPDC051310]|uniref:hypothetical protein n=1 Tax=Streptomyces sp. NPDC051310 TaxID=3365649 RepID=UPI0037A2D3E9